MTIFNLCGETGAEKEDQKNDNHKKFRCKKERKNMDNILV